MAPTFRALPLVLLAALAACDAPSPRSIRDAPFDDSFIPATTLVCEDKRSVRVLYPDRQSASLTIEGNTYRLMSAVSGSGARYTGGGLQWWSEGDEAMLAPLKSGEEIASDPGVRCVPATRSLDPEQPAQAGNAQAAATVVETYFALIESGRVEAAAKLRLDGMRQELGSYLTLGAQVGAPGRIRAVGRSLFVDVPVSIYGRRVSGEAYLKGGNVGLRRAADGPGVSAQQRQWRIERFQLETTPSASRPIR